MSAQPAPAPAPDPGVTVLDVPLETPRLLLVPLTPALADAALHGRPLPGGLVAAEDWPTDDAGVVLARACLADPGIEPVIGVRRSRSHAPADPLPGTPITPITPRGPEPVIGVRRSRSHAPADPLPGTPITPRGPGPVIGVRRSRSHAPADPLPSTPITPRGAEPVIELHGSASPAPTGQWLVTLRQGLVVVGECGVRGWTAGGEPEVGYGLAPSARGRGLATEAVARLVGHLFAVPGVNAVVAETEAGNAASRRLLSRLGFAAVPGPAGPGPAAGPLTFRRARPEPQALSASVG